MKAAALQVTAAAAGPARPLPLLCRHPPLRPQETTFVMIKPDGVQRNLIAPILDRFLAKVRAAGRRHYCRTDKTAPGCSQLPPCSALAALQLAVPPD